MLQTDRSTDGATWDELLARWQEQRPYEPLREPIRRGRRHLRDAAAPIRTAKPFASEIPMLLAPAPTAAAIAAWPDAHRRVLLVLLEATSPTHDDCWVRQVVIAQRAGITDRHVRTILKALESAAALPLREHAPRRQGSARYGGCDHFLLHPALVDAFWNARSAAAREPYRRRETPASAKPEFRVIEADRNPSRGSDMKLSRTQSLSNEPARSCAREQDQQRNVTRRDDARRSVASTALERLGFTVKAIPAAIERYGSDRCLEVATAIETLPNRRELRNPAGLARRVLRGDVTLYNRPMTKQDREALRQRKSGQTAERDHERRMLEAKKPLRFKSGDPYELLSHLPSASIDAIVEDAIADFEGRNLENLPYALQQLFIDRRAIELAIERGLYTPRWPHDARPFSPRSSFTRKDFTYVQNDHRTKHGRYGDVG